MSCDPKAMKLAILNNLEKKTGYGLDHWLSELKPFGAADKRAAVAHLRAKGLGHFQAVAVYENSIGRAVYDDAAGLEDKLYGDDLRPAYDHLKQFALGIGADITVRPCQTYTPFYAKRTFAIAAPSEGGIQVGLALGQTDDVDAAEAVSAFKGSKRMSHVITLPADGRLTEAQQSLLRQAYQSNA